MKNRVSFWHNFLIFDANELNLSFENVCIAFTKSISSFLHTYFQLLVCYIIFAFGEFIDLLNITIVLTIRHPATCVLKMQQNNCFTCELILNNFWKLIYLKFSQRKNSKTWTNHYNLYWHSVIKKVFTRF